MGNRLAQYRIFVNNTLKERRIAFCTHDRVEEVWIDRGDNTDYIVGNIYQGVVERVLPGMEAAFVDIGQERNGFLYGGDLADEDEGGGGLDYIEDDDTQPPYVTPSFKSLKSGDKIIVQVTKGPIASKGARLKAEFSIPGKFLVLMPTHSRIGISRKIQDSRKRKQLHSAIREARKKANVKYGVVIRTAGLMINSDKLQAEYIGLARVWDDVLSSRNKVKAPAVLYSDSSAIDRLLREYCTNPNTKIIVDNADLHAHITEKAKDRYFFPTRNIVLFSKGGPLFEHFGIENAIQKALDRRVWLKSGGYLVFDQTEALTVIDVNTGRFVGRKQLEQTLVKNNMEAAEEIVYQVILRNISGIIVIDFIDMEEEHHRSQILDTLKKLFREDKARNSVLAMTQLGLVQITRRRTHRPLKDQLCTPCYYCEGKGYIKSQDTVAMEIFRNLFSKQKITKKNKFSVKLSEDLKRFLTEKYGTLMKEVFQSYNLRVTWEGKPHYHQEEYEII